MVGSPPTQPSPSAFPELLGSAKRFAAASPRPHKVTSPSHRPSPGKPASPTIQQLFSRQAASQSPAASKAVSNLSKPVSIPAKIAFGKRAAADNLAASASQATARAGTPQSQDDSSLVKQAAELLSEAYKTSPAGKAHHRSSRRADSVRAAAWPQGPSALSPDAASAVEAERTPSEQAVEVDSPAHGQQGGAALQLPRSTGMHSQRSAGSHQGSHKSNQRQRGKLDRRPSGQQAEVIDLLDSD